jgi:putative component of membrane protein insertase Oxa1/YidC/SpoIIIJ protein YidD
MPEPFFGGQCRFYRLLGVCIWAIDTHGTLRGSWLY